MLHLVEKTSRQRLVIIGIRTARAGGTGGGVAPAGAEAAPPGAGVVVPASSGPEERGVESDIGVLPPVTRSWRRVHLGTAENTRPAGRRPTARWRALRRGDGAAPGRSTQSELLVQGGQRRLAVALLDHAGDRRHRGRDRLDVDPGPGERSEHPARDAGLGLQPMAEQADERDVDVPDQPFGADLVADRFEIVVDGALLVARHGQRDVRGPVLATRRHHQLDVDVLPSERAEDVGGDSGAVRHADVGDLGDVPIGDRPQRFHGVSPLRSLPRVMMMRVPMEPRGGGRVNRKSVGRRGEPDVTHCGNA